MTTNAITHDWLDLFKKRFSAHQYSIEHQDLNTHAQDKWYARALPDVVFFAEKTEDVVDLMRFSKDHQVPVTTRGAGVGYVGACVPVRGGIALSMMRMNRIISIEPENGIAVVQPGVITVKLQDAVSQLNWYYPPDPASLKECSLGGNIATNAGGPRCLKYGVTRHYVLGLEIVMADGSLVRTGGKIHKNKSGFDLIGLMVGSEGMLGIVTEATLRIIPKPPARAMLAVIFEDFSQSAHAVQVILQAGHLPSALEITDSFTLSSARKRLGEDTFPPGNAHLIVEIDGRSHAVMHEIAEIRDLLYSLDASHIHLATTEADCEHIWHLRREFSYSLRDTGLTKLNEDIVIPRSKLVDLVQFTQQLQASTGIQIACFGHAGDGNIHTNLMVKDYNDSEIKAHADSALNLLFQWVLKQGGAITGEHGVGIAKKPWIQQALGKSAFSLHQQLKHALDPENLLNPGKFLDP